MLKIVKKNKIYIIIILLLSIVLFLFYFKNRDTKEVFEDKIEELLNEDKFSREELIDLSIKYQGKANDIPVLLYHHLLPEKDIKSENPSVVSKEDFKEQMQWLYDNNYYTATMEELESYLKGKLELPKNTVVITFDDGYLSNLVHGYPILEKYRQKATIFMIGDVSEKPQEEYSSKGLQFINTQTIYDYEDVFHFGSHTYSMHKKDGDLFRLTSYNEEQIKKDLLKNEELFSSKYFAYPHGQYDENTLEILDELEYKLAFGTEYGYVNKDTNIYEISRIMIYPNTELDEFISIVTPN